MDKINFEYILYIFFCEIDFYCDGHIEWEEFTQFIIDTVDDDIDTKIKFNNTINIKSIIKSKIKKIHKNQKNKIKKKLKK